MDFSGRKATATVRIFEQLKRPGRGCWHFCGSIFKENGENCNEKWPLPARERPLFGKGPSEGSSEGIIE